MTTSGETAVLFQLVRGLLQKAVFRGIGSFHNKDALAQAARAISELTHFDPEAGDACVLWCAAIRHAVHTGELDVRIGLPHIPVDRREVWVQRLVEAEASQPSAFTRSNGWVVAALPMGVPSGCRLPTTRYSMPAARR